MSDVDTGQAYTDGWHYKDEGSGKRVGPVGRVDIAKLIEASRIDRTTLVWHPAMTDWAKAGHSELSELFGTEPPPLPATEINRAAIYVLAFFPLWGSFVQLLASAPIASQLEMMPRAAFDRWWWLVAFTVGNILLAAWDKHNLEKSGLKLPGALLLAFILIPIYILGSCRAVYRHSDRRSWLTYMPALLWVIAFAGQIFMSAVAFNPDAPAIFSPNEWF